MAVPGQQRVVYASPISSRAPEVSRITSRYRSIQQKLSLIAVLHDVVLAILFEDGHH